MEDEHLAQVACECLQLDCPEPDLDEWRAMCKAWKNPTKKVTVALVGKYIQLHDAYISVVEALKHGGVYNSADVTIKWVDSETVTAENAAEILGDVSGILVPGGFGDRGIRSARFRQSAMQENTMYHSLVSASECSYLSLNLQEM